jgi:hypothetical protein
VDPNGKGHPADGIAPGSSVLPAAGDGGFTQPPHLPHVDPAKIDTYQRNQKWFKQTNLDLGTHFQEASIIGTFEFSNPTGVEQKIVNMLPSCGCTDVTMEIDGKLVAIAKPFVGEVVVPPDVPCKLKVKMDLRGVVGEKTGDIRIQTTDPELPFVSLQVKAAAKVFFEISPDNVHLGELNYSDQREFVVSVTSPHTKRWNILGNEGLPPKTKIDLKKIDEPDRTRYEIRGTIGPGLEEGGAGGTITFKTDVEDRTFAVNVSGFVMGPLKVTPSFFLSFGHVPFGTRKQIDIEFVCKDQNHKLAVEKVEFMDLQNGLEPAHLDYSVKDVEAGQKLILAVWLKESAPRAQGRGKIRVHLNHPSAKSRDFSFNAFIR